jgi:hypothetical protein
MSCRVLGLISHSGRTLTNGSRRRSSSATLKRASPGEVVSHNIRLVMYWSGCVYADKQVWGQLPRVT